MFIEVQFRPCPKLVFFLPKFWSLGLTLAQRFGLKKHNKFICAIRASTFNCSIGSNVVLKSPPEVSAIPCQPTSLATPHLQKSCFGLKTCHFSGLPLPHHLHQWLTECWSLSLASHLFPPVSVLLGQLLGQQPLHPSGEGEGETKVAGIQNHWTISGG